MDSLEINSGGRKMRIVTIVGARPQIIKAAALSNSLGNYKEIEEILVHTGQHYDQNMSEIFFEELGLNEPMFNLGIGSGSHAFQTGEMMKGIEDIVEEVRPEMMLVYGDTNSTLAGSLVAAKCKVPLAHVEGGLRSNNKSMPEEINRIVTDRLSDIIFCPTEKSMSNLRREGFGEGDIHLVGDVMYDACILFGQISKQNSTILKELDLFDKDYILATIHRAENTDNSEILRKIISALSKLSKDIPVVIPLHPRTRDRIDSIGEGISFIEPVGYLDMIELERNARTIVTDSGGVQKEAYFHRVPCITIRPETEWTELIDIGWNVIVNPNETSVFEKNLFSVLENQRIGDSEVDIYGGGKASERICDLILRWKENL